MYGQNKCPICANDANYDPKQGDYEPIECPTTGAFNITNSAIITLKRVHLENVYSDILLSHFIRRIDSSSVKINSNWIENIIKQNELPNLANQFNYLMIWMAKKQKPVSKIIYILDEKIMELKGYCGLMEDQDVYFIIDEGVNKGLIQSQTHHSSPYAGKAFRLSIDGFK